MTPQQEKYLVSTNGQILNTLLNIHAESRATKELLILIAKGSLKFPDGHSAESFWQACFDRALTELSKQSKEIILKEIQ